MLMGMLQAAAGAPAQLAELERKAALAAQADELRSRMKESQLANFQAEARNRWGLHILWPESCLVSWSQFKRRRRRATGKI